MSAVKPANLFAIGKAAAADWLAENRRRPKGITAEVCRAVRLTDAVLQYEAAPNFPELLAAWERGFDSTMRAGSAPSPVQAPDELTALELESDLRDILALTVDIGRGVETCLALAQPPRDADQADERELAPDGGNLDRLLRLAQISARLLSDDAERRIARLSTGVRP